MSLSTPIFDVSCPGRARGGDEHRAEGDRRHCLEFHSHSLRWFFPDREDAQSPRVWQRGRRPFFDLSIIFAPWVSARYGSAQIDHSRGNYAIGPTTSASTATRPITSR